MVLGNPTETGPQLVTYYIPQPARLNLVRAGYQRFENLRAQLA